jgi:hypothetical protein
MPCIRARIIRSFAVRMTGHEGRDVLNSGKTSRNRPKAQQSALKSSLSGNSFTGWFLFGVVLPALHGENFRRPGVPVDHVGIDHRFQILSFPVFRCHGEHRVQISWVIQDFAGCFRSLA